MDAVRESYYETRAERSVLKNSAKHKANGSAVTKLGNKPVTTKEIYGKHGPIITFPSTDSFMSYSDFVRLPQDLKVEFVNKMMDRYDISLKYISRHLFNKGYDGLRAMMEKWKLLKQVDMKKKRGDVDESIRRFREEVFDWQERTKKAKETDRIQNQMRKESCPTLITYAEFKKLSPDDQADFINRAIKYHQVSAAIIAEELFKIRATSLYNHFQRIGITKKIEKLPTKVSRNQAVMHENRRKFASMVSTWEDFAEIEDQKSEKVVDIQSTLEKSAKKELVADNIPERKVINMPSDDEFVFDQRTIVNKTDSMIWKAAMIDTLEQNMKELEERINEKINKPLTSDEILKHEDIPAIPLEFRTGWYQPIEKPEVVTEPDPMEYHQIHFSTSYISSNGINMEEIYAIAVFFKNCKHVKVNLEISEV